MGYVKYKDIPNRREPLSGRDHIQHIENALQGVVPGPGEVIVGSADGPVAVPASTITLTPQGIANEAPRINEALASPIPEGQAVRHVTLIGTFSVAQAIVVHTNTVLDLSRATIRFSPGAGGRLIESRATREAGRDSNITIYLGVIDRGGASGSPGDGSNSLHSVVMRKVDGLTLRGGTFRSTGGKFSILLQNVTNFIVDGPFMDNTASDGVHVQGPARSGRIANVSGTTGDDLVALTPLDYTGYTWGDEGDIEDVVIENIHASRVAKNAVKVLGGNGLVSRNVRVRNIFGTTDFYGIWLGDGPADPNTSNGRVEGVTVENVSMSSSSPTFHLIHIDGADIGDIAASSLRLDAATADQKVVIVSSASVIDRLDLSGIHASCEHVFIGGTVRSLTVSRASGTIPTAKNLIMLNGANAKVTRLAVIDATPTFQPSSGSLIRADNGGSALAAVTLINVAPVVHPAWMLDGNQVTDVSLSNVRSGGGLFNLRASASLTVRGDATYSGTISNSAGGKCHPRSLSLPVDLAKVAVAAGNMAYNTNGALSCGTGPVVCDGTTWKHLHTGATYTP